uniref:Uncharacterized protein n=1 Tax=Tanacetum cinerariifolium TaxID=118510 RepID=A0A6L2NVE6_TANCI|nr:hypothetical protein [Tanacetum cinerariifolium]
MIFDGMVRNVNNKEHATLRKYSRRATRIAQPKALPTATDEHASLLRDVSQGEAFPTVSGLDAGQDRENIVKTSALPHDSTPRVTSLDADDGKIGEEAGVEKSTKQGSNDTEEIVNVQTFMNAAKILTSKVQAISVPPIAEVSTVGVPTVSRLVPTISAIFTTVSVVTPYSRRPKEISAKDKGIEKVVESKTPKKKKLQEQINVQVAREMEEEMAREDQRLNEQIARDAKIARIHVEEELKMMIDGLDRSNEMIAKHLHNKTLSKKEQRKFYMSVIRSHSGGKTRHFREEVKRFKKKGLRLEPGSAKKIKTSEDVSEEDIKEMMQLVPVEEVYVEALQVKHPIIDWEIHSERQKDYWKIIRLRGHTTVYQYFYGYAESV